MISPTMSTESALIQIIRPMREKVWSAHFAWNRFERFEKPHGQDPAVTGNPWTPTI